MLQQRLDRMARVVAPDALGQVGMGQQDLRNLPLMQREGLPVRGHQRDLSGRRGGLTHRNR